MSDSFDYDVFLSHSAKDKAVVRPLAERLRADGVKLWFDEWVLKPGDSIPAKIEEGLERSRVLVLCMSANAFGPDWAQLESGTFRFREPLNKERRFLPLRLDDAPIKGSLGQFLYIDWRLEDREQEYTKLLEACRLPEVEPHASSTKHSCDISRIVKYAPAEFIGRADELRLLNDAWAKVQNNEKGQPHILTFVALGGEGKTSLVAKWAAELATKDWPGCDAAFAWSFYSQGTRERLAASSDLFLKEALTFFGDDADKQFANGSAGAFEKGQRLAHLVGQRRNLLILDGLEPLQYAPTSPTPGQLKDQGIAALLKGLAAASHGLCIVTTRYSLLDLRAFWQTTAPEVKLLRLSREAGVHLLNTLGVTGTAKEFETLVEEVKGHALTLTLLGSYLRDAHGGDIRKRDLVKLEQADEHGGHAFRIVDAYMSWFSSEGSQGRESLAILRLLGLSDDPVTADQLDELLKGPAIPGLTEALIGNDEARWNLALARLERAQLITVNRIAGELISFDAHPLIRAYITTQLRRENPSGIEAALSRLDVRKTELAKRVTPLRLYFESELFTSEEIAELLGYVSDYYAHITGDRLIIESQGTLEASGVPVPQEA